MLSAALLSKMYSVSARIWRRYSSGSKDILSLGQYVGTDKGAQRLCRNQFYGLFQQSFEQLPESQKAVVCLPLWLELDQQIDVAVRARFATSRRSKKRKSADTQASHLDLRRTQALNNLLPAYPDRSHPQ